MLIFKVLRPEEFMRLEKGSLSCGSKTDTKDRFIHFSTKEQLKGTLEKHYPGEQNLILMAVESQTLGEALVWEEGRQNQLFPHFYGKLQFDHGLWYSPLEYQGNSYIFPSGF